MTRARDMHETVGVVFSELTPTLEEIGAMGQAEAAMVQGLCADLANAGWELTERLLSHPGAVEALPYDAQQAYGVLDRASKRLDVFLGLMSRMKDGEAATG